MKRKTGKIKISVITPVHNTDLSFLEKTARSVSEIDFDKKSLEWVVVFHNCDEGYEKEAERVLLSDTLNVRIFTLKDENHTPSAPRNMGLKEALGDYVYFLDSDDVVEPSFPGKAYEAATVHKGQMVVAGAKQESIQKNVMPLPMPLLLYSSEGIHIIDNKKYISASGKEKRRRNRDELGRLIYGAPMFLGTKLIGRKLIEESGALFDENLEYLEDVCFETALYGAADRIVVLTDEIAYTYRQHEGSTFQSILAKDRIDAGVLLEPVKRIVSRCEKEDIDYNLFLWSIFEMLGSAILRGDMPQAVTDRVMKEMAEYVEKLRPIPYVGPDGAKELVSMKFLADIFVDKKHRAYKQDRIDITFQDMVEKIGDYSGTAIVTDNGSVTYEELDELSDRIASCIIGRLKTGKVTVGVFMDNSIERIIAAIAVIKSGYPLVILSKHGSSERLSYIADAAGVEMLLADAEEIDAKALFHKDIEVVTYKEGTSKKCEIDIGGLHLRDSAPMVIEFTSGSEGNPKGVEFSRRNFINFLYHFDGNVKNCHQSRVSNTFIIHMEIDFLFGLLLSLEALLFGKKLCLLRNTKDIGADFARECLTKDDGVSISAVPSVADEWFTDPEYDGLFKRVVLIVYGGEGIKKEQLERAGKAIKEGASIYSGFATTETGPAVYGVVTMDKIDCGRPYDDVCVTIIDNDGNPLPYEEKGRVCIKSYGVANGYINGSNEDFIIDRSGINTFISRDEGYIKSSGELVICGRLDRMIKQKGVRIDPSEIERAVISYPGIENVAAKSFEGSGICCFYTAKEKVDEFKLRVFLSGKLPYFMMPECFCHLENMPVTERGKLDLKALTMPEELLHKNSIKKSEKTLPETLGKVLEAFRKEFSPDEVEEGDNFFYLGGDSIRAVKLSLLLCEEGLDVGMQDVFKYPSPILLAKAVDEGLTASGKERQEESASREGYINDTGLKEYDAPPSSDCEYAFELTGITKGYFTMPDTYREAYRYALRIQYTTTEQLDREILGERVRSIVSAHPMLRCELANGKNGKVFGFVRKKWQEEVTYRDISRYPKETARGFLSGFWKAMDQENRLFSVACFKVDDQRHVVLVRMTHMVTDAIGSGILLKEISGKASPSEAEDNFIAVKRRSVRKLREEKEKAAAFFEEYLKNAQPAAVNPPFGIVEENTKVLRKFVRLDKDHVKRLKEKAAHIGVSFENLIQYEYARALSGAISKDRIIFLCTFSGRDESNIEAVGNFFTVLPVVYDSQMGPVDFAENILKLNEYSYLDSDMVGRLAKIPFSALGTAEGINSNIIEDSLNDPRISDAKQVIFEDLRGKRMYMEGDELVIEMSYYDMDVTDRVYNEIEKRMKEAFKAI